MTVRKFISATLFIMKSAGVLLMCALPLLFDGCISVVDPEAGKITPQPVAFQDFAGHYHPSAVRYSQVKGQQRWIRNIAFELEPFSPIPPAKSELESFDIGCADGLVITLHRHHGDPQTIRFVEGRDYEFAEGVIKFASKHQTKDAADAGHAEVTRTMNWMMDGQNRLVVVFGARAVGAAFYLVPFVSRSRGYAVYERK